jgi:hypothetical protein
MKLAEMLINNIKVQKSRWLIAKRQSRAQMRKYK